MRAARTTDIAISSTPNMLPWPAFTLLADANTAASVSYTATATASATPNTMGAWQEIIAATSADAYGIVMWLTGAISQNGQYRGVMVSVGLGAASGEAVKIERITLSGNSFSDNPIFFPLWIPKGSRIALQLQSTTASQTATFAMHLVAADRRLPRPPSDLHYVEGAEAPTSGGTLLTAPGSVNTKSAWTMLNTLGRPVVALIPILTNGSAQQNTADILFDVGIGPNSSSVTVVIADVEAVSAGNEAVNPRSRFPYAVDIPRGATVWGRYAASNLTLSGDKLHLQVIGVPA